MSQTKQTPESLGRIAQRRKCGTAEAACRNAYSFGWAVPAKSFRDPVSFFPLRSTASMSAPNAGIAEGAGNAAGLPEQQKSWCDICASAEIVLEFNTELLSWRRQLTRKAPP